MNRKKPAKAYRTGFCSWDANEQQHRSCPKDFAATGGCGCPCHEGGHPWETRPKRHPLSV